MLFYRFIFTSLLILVFGCNSREKEISSQENIKESQKFSKRTIVLDQKENSYEGTFKFDLSYGRSEVFYFIHFNRDLSSVKVKIESKELINDNYYEENDYEEDYVSLREEKFSDELIGNLKVISDSELFIKCKMTLAEIDTYILYFDKKKNNWYIDVNSTIYSDVKSIKTIYGTRTNEKL